MSGKFTPVQIEVVADFLEFHEGFEKALRVKPVSDNPDFYLRGLDERSRLEQRMRSRGVAALTTADYQELETEVGEEIERRRKDRLEAIEKRQRREHKRSEAKRDLERAFA
jgi:hypothetical protein